MDEGLPTTPTAMNPEVTITAPSGLTELVETRALKSGIAASQATEPAQCVNALRKATETCPP